jgi:tRNA1Val (adenine37-N6)-methyltransferase
MKVGTDAVLLSGWMPVPDECKAILDIGSGCGVIALMLAQKTEAKIIGIDIDEKSVKEAQNNAENSPWGDKVQFIHEKVQDFAQKTTQKFELIVSNPPFFENSLKSPDNSRNIARHNDTLSLQELIDAVDILLSINGRFGVILPTEPAEKLENLALEKKIYATKKSYVYSTSKKMANRILMMFERKYNVCEKDNLVLRDEGYTDDYLRLVNGYLTLSKFAV